MKKKAKRIIRVTSITLLSLILLILAAIGVAVNFVFTPEKLTPVVLRVANSTLNAHVEMSSVELTFFSTFPRFGLRMTDGTLISKTFRDSAWQRTDSLVSFKKCLIIVNPIDYLQKHKLTLNRLKLDSASVYAFKSREGIANWDIMYTDSAPMDTTAKQDTVSAFRLDGGIEIRKVVFSHTHVVFDDRDTRVYARLEDANMKLSASLKKECSLLDLKFDNKNILFWQEGQLLLNHISTDLETNLELDRLKKTLKLNSTSISVNGIKLDVEGILQADTLKKTIGMDVTYGLHAPSLETVLHMIPESVLKKEQVTAKGEVKVSGTLKGKYGKGNMPKATLMVQIKDASAQYKGMPYGVDNITADFYGEVDLMRQSPSYADLKIFRFQGAHTDILADAKIQDLLGDPDIAFHTVSTVDLTSLAKTFPLQDGVTIEGKLDADLDVKCRLSSIRNRDIGRIKAKGKLTMQNFSLRDFNKGFQFTSNATLAFKGNDLLMAHAEVKNLVLESKRISSTLDRFKADVKTTNPQDTTRIADLTCKLEMNKLKAGMGDSVRLFCGHTAATIHLQPGKLNPSKPRIKLSLEADSLFARMEGNKMGMNKAGFAVEAEKLRDSLWAPKGIIGFNRLVMKTPAFALPIRMKKTAVTVGNHTITLKNASMRIGHSDLTASGAVYNLYKSIKEKTLLRAHLTVTSRNLDCNQLINAMSVPQDSIQDMTDVIADTDSVGSGATDLSLFVIPKNIDFELQTKLQKVKYDNMVFEDVRGSVDVRNQAVHLKNLSMRGMDASMNTTLVYRADRKERGYVGFDFRLQDVNIAKLVDFVPSLDTIVPMLRSFKGMVDFEAAAEAVLDSNLYIKIPTLRSAMHIRGDSLVLMDGETFAEISKMLMFKNKKRNVFDSISVNVTVQDGNVTIYPFLVNIDRYQAAVGGNQSLDMNLDYHISILKSPLPFKAGVNITGTLDDMKIRIGKAKYKDAVTPVAIRKVDSTRINLGAEIAKDFMKVMRRQGQE